MRTKEEILDKMFEEMPYQMIGKEQLLPYIKEAMEIYAQEQVKNCSIPDVVGRSEQFFCCKDQIDQRCGEQCLGCYVYVNDKV